MQTRRIPMRRLAIVAACLFAARQLGETQSAGEDQVRAANAPPTLRFPVNPTRPWFYARIERTNATGVIEIKPARTLPRSAELTEGYYLAIAHKTLTPSLSSPRVIRVNVSEVSHRGAAKLMVSPAVAEVLKRGEFLTLFRPTAVTTAELKEFPDDVVAVEGVASWPKSQAESGVCLTRSVNNLRSISLALFQFDTKFKHFPPAAVYGPDGKPWHSWRVLILPYLERADLYSKYRWDEPWDGPNNSKLLEEMPSCYSDPIYGENSEFYTHYSAITGPGMAFSHKGAPFDGKEVDPAKLRGTKISDFTDSTGDTLFVGPVGPDRKIPWMKPEDVEVGKDFPQLGKPGSFAVPYQTEKGNGGPFLRADAVILIIPRGIDLEMFRSALTISGGEFVDWSEIRGADLPPGKVLVPVIRISTGSQKPIARLMIEEIALPSPIFPPADVIDPAADESPKKTED